MATEITRAEKQLVDAQNSVASMMRSEKGMRRLRDAAPSHMRTDRLVNVLLTQMRKIPDLCQCEPSSLCAALVDCAELGLEPNGIQAYLIPFKNRKKGIMEVQLIPGYRGMIDLAYRSGRIHSIRAEAVHERDEFEFAFGLSEKLVHRPTDEDDPGKLKFAYAVAHMKDGGHSFTVLNRRQVLAHKSKSQSASSQYSPWNDPVSEPAMWAKTAMRVLAKFIPQSPELERAIQMEDEYAGYGGSTFDVQPTPVGRRVPRSTLLGQDHNAAPQDEPHLEAFDVCTSPESVDEAVKDMLSEGVPPEDEDFIRRAGETRKRQLGGKLFNDEPIQGERAYQD